VSEKLEVHINNTYDSSYKLVSTAKIWNGKALVSEWTTKTPESTIHQGIDASEPNVFMALKMKRMLAKAMNLFEPKIITIEGKENGR